MRRNPECYSIFFARFLPCVTGKTLWNSRLKRAKKDSDMCGNADESFALLLLENSYNRWTDLFSKEKALRESGSDEKAFSSVSTLYTAPGQSYDDREIKTCARGWIKDGIRRFNRLVDKMRKDRSRNTSFFINWNEKYLESNEPKKRKKRVDDQPHIIAKDDLFNSIDDDEK